MYKRTGSGSAPLFTRIETEGLRSMTVNDWMDEIGESLSILFNTHEGSAATRVDFGMPEFQPDEIRILSELQSKAKQIKMLIEKFEPRLHSVVVKAGAEQESAYRTLFEVQALLDQSLSGEQVSYRTVMTGNGRVWLKK